MPAPRKSGSLPPPRRSRRRAGKVLSLPEVPKPPVVVEAEAPLPEVSPGPPPPGEDADPPVMAVPASALVPEVRRRRRPTSEWPVWARRPRRLSVSPVALALALLAAVGFGAGLATLLHTGKRLPAPAPAGRPVADGSPTPATAPESATTLPGPAAAGRARETE